MPERQIRVSPTLYRVWQTAVVVIGLGLAGYLALSVLAGAWGHAAAAALLLAAAVSGFVSNRRAFRGGELSGTAEAPPAEPVEEITAALDLDAIRHVRDTQGALDAVRAVRTQHPSLSLKQATEIVESL